MGISRTFADRKQPVLSPRMAVQRWSIGPPFGWSRLFFSAFAPILAYTTPKWGYVGKHRKKGLKCPIIPKYFRGILNFQRRV
jgi:hypothetical protein